MSEALFALASDGIKVTSDDCYTPKWVFDAMGIKFDLDVAAPPGGPWHVPAKRYFTAEDDGLEQPWEGTVWCNPPYSGFLPWAERWKAHPTGVLMGYELPQVRWKRPDGKSYRLRQSIFVAFRGVGTEAAERLAAASPYSAVLYGRAAA